MISAWVCASALQTSLEQQIYIFNYERLSISFNIIVMMHEAIL